MDWRKLVFTLILIASMIGSFWYLYDFASKPVFHDYVSDEVWYVPASRNILHRLGVDLTYINGTTGSRGVNVIFANESTQAKYAYTVGEIALEHNATYELTYYNFPGLYFEIPSENFQPFLKSLAETLPNGSYYVVPGFWYPDKDNIQNYLNTEHPFLGKDFIMLGMLFGDRPINWRVPGIIAFALIQLLVALAAYKISGSYLAALIALVFTVADPTLEAMSFIAMLDIYVALFVSLFIFLLAYDRDRWGAFAVGLAGATKLSGGFGWPVLLIRAFKREKSLLRFLAVAFLLPALGFLIPNIPGMAAVGPVEWLNQFLGSFRWHLSDKGGSQNAAPVWWWFVDKNPFPLHFNPNVFAQTDPVLLLSMVLFILALPWLYRRKGKILEPFGVFWFTVLFFLLQYALGGTTQYSFYTTALVPPAAVVMGVSLNELLRWEAFTTSLRTYFEWLIRLKDGLVLRVR